LADAIVCEPHAWQPWALAAYTVGDDCKLGHQYVCPTCTAVELWPICKFDRAWIRRCPSCDAAEYWRPIGTEPPDPSPLVRGWLMPSPSALAEGWSAPRRPAPAPVRLPE